MAFVDDLGMELYSLAFVALLVLYISAKAYLSYRKGERDLLGKMRDGVMPLAVLGAFIFIMGLFGEFVWSLPGSYNILFYDPYVLLGVLLLGASATIYMKGKLQNVGFLSLMMGIVLLSYGASGYALGMSSSPLALLGLFTSFGIAAVFAYPFTLVIDAAKQTGRTHRGVWTWMVAIFFLALIVAAGVSVLIGAMAIPAHLAVAP